MCWCTYYTNHLLIKTFVRNTSFQSAPVLLYFYRRGVVYLLSAVGARPVVGEFSTSISCHLRLGLCTDSWRSRIPMKRCSVMLVFVRFHDGIGMVCEWAKWRLYYGL
jgi:hypothetical protein